MIHMSEITMNDLYFIFYYNKMLTHMRLWAYITNLIEFLYIKDERHIKEDKKK